MILGIDETGTFSLESPTLNLFAVVHLLEPADRQKLATHLAQWKKRYKQRATINRTNKNGEIKGSDLSDDELADFVNHVIRRQGQYFYISICGIVPNEHKEKDILYRQRHSIASLEKGIKEAEAIGNTNLVRQCRELNNWYGNLPPQLVMKLSVLGETIGHAWRNHTGMVIVDRRDMTLGTFLISIDQDFIRRETHVDFWKFILGNQVWAYTYKNPLPALKEWPPDHPGLRGRTLASHANGRATVVDTDFVFRDGCDFYPSHERAELEVADIVASIASRHYNGNNAKVAFARIERYLIPRREPLHLIRLAGENDRQANAAPDPRTIISQS
jgi:hypothetical protein